MQYWFSRGYWATVFTALLLIVETPVAVGAPAQCQGFVGGSSPSDAQQLQQPRMHRAAAG